MGDSTDSVKLSVLRGPVRASQLIHPRLPRHLQKHHQGEGEQRAEAKPADGGDHDPKQQAPLLDKKELSVVEKHQLQAPAQMMAQLRRNSLILQETGGQPQTTSAVSKEMATSHSQPQETSVRNLSTHSQSQTTLEHNATGISNSANRRPKFHDPSEEKRHKLEQSQLVSGGPDPTFMRSYSSGDADGHETSLLAKVRKSMPRYAEIRRNQQQEQMGQVGTIPKTVRSNSTEDVGSQDVQSILAKLRRSAFMFAESQKSHSGDQPISDTGSSSKTAVPLTVPRRNSSHDVCDSRGSDSGCSTPVEELSELVKPSAVPMFMSRHQNQNFLQSMYHSLRSYALPKAGNKTGDLPSTSMAKSDGGDPDITDVLPEHSEKNTAAQIMLRDEESKHDSPCTRGRAGGDSERKVKDLESRMETLSTKSRSEEREHQESFSHSMPTFRRRIVSSPYSSLPQKAECDQQAPSPLNYCKLQIGKGSRSYSILIVCPEMEKLVEIHGLLNAATDAQMIKSGTCDDLVDEISSQMGVQLVMQKLQALPPSGQYSVQKLVTLSASPLAHQQPSHWDEVIQKFEREGIEGILLRSEEVRFFEPDDYRLPDGERTFRSVDQKTSIRM